MHNNLKSLTRLDYSIILQSNPQSLIFSDISAQLQQLLQKLSNTNKSIRTCNTQKYQPNLSTNEAQKQEQHCFFQSTLEKTITKSHIQNDSKSTFVSSYYIAQAARAVLQKFSLAMQHIQQMMQQIGQIQMISHHLKAPKQLYLPKHPFYKHKKTLVLDLDETLVHSIMGIKQGCDLQVRLQDDGIFQQFGVYVRPYTISFLKSMVSMFEIIVFTSGSQNYADGILDILDPNNQYVQHRLYKEHCIDLGYSTMLKDLSILGRDLSQIVLVDNSVCSFALQIDNGIPIVPYYQGPDRTLLGLQQYLQVLVTVQDVRSVNQKQFKLDQYKNFSNKQKLVAQLYACKL